MLYLDNFTFLLYRLSLLFIQICYLTAGDKLTDDLDVKIAVTTIRDDLRIENIVIRKE